jgi:hypothetical protein
MRSRSVTLGAAAANHDNDSSIESSRDPSRKNLSIEPSTNAAQSNIAVRICQPPLEKLRLIYLCN